MLVELSPNLADVFGWRRRILEMSPDHWRAAGQDSAHEVQEAGIGGFLAAVSFAESVARTHASTSSAKTNSL
jgi:hypothetical protein